MNATDQRLTDLEIKLSYAEDLLDSLNAVVAQQQDQIDRLRQALLELQRRQAGDGLSAARNPRDELPPHY